MTEILFKIVIQYIWEIQDILCFWESGHESRMSLNDGGVLASPLRDFSRSYLKNSNSHTIGFNFSINTW